MESKFTSWMNLENKTDLEVATRIGVHWIHVYKIRRGALVPSPSFAWKFAKAYGFELAQKLFDSEGEKSL